MHGLIHTELERWAAADLGAELWARAARHAGVADKVYDPAVRYDDDEIVTLVMTLARESGIGPQALLERFGAALAPTLLEAYAHLVPDGWHTLELIENTEEMIHTALRRDDVAARPPQLRTSRRGADEVLLIYASPRRMCGFAKGLVRGVADAYGDDVAITEEQCMLSGDPTCDLAIRRAA